MDQATVDGELDAAAKEILASKHSLAVLMRVLNRVRSQGYKSGLSQGHHDRDFPEG